MNNQPLILLPALALLAVSAGCSARVEAFDENTTEKSRVVMEVGVLADRQPEPITAPATTPEKRPVAQESRPAPEPVSREEESVSAEKSVKLVRNVVNVYEGDLHLHEHLHVHGSPRKPREKAKVRVEVVQKPQRSERLMKAHLSRLSKWEAIFQRGGR